ncbi:MAG: hypothetical protein AAGI23_01250 [Bacteroidota bacterium]
MRHLAVGLFSLLILGCSSSSLDKTFNPDLYNGYYQQILSQKEASLNELFLMNYSVLRQRDYYGYEVEGMTYGELIEQAKELSQSGLAVEYVYETPAVPEGITLDIDVEGSSTVRPNPSSSRLIRVARFAVGFQNTTANDIALLNCSFILKGPFQDYITTAGYEINCKIEAGETLRIGFFVDARVIRDNVTYDQNYEVDQIDLETLLASLNITLGGLSIEENPAYFERCIDTNARREPFRTISIYEDLEEQDWIQRTEGTTKLVVGNTFLQPEEEDMRTIQLGN